MSNEVLIGVIADLESELDRYKKAIDVAMRFINENEVTLEKCEVYEFKQEINQILGKEEGEK